MTNEQFHSQENNNLLETIELLEKHCGDIALVSFGLAPNPFGFCYEVYNTYNKVPRTDLNALDFLLGNLNDAQEMQLRELYL